MMAKFATKYFVVYNFALNTFVFNEDQSVANASVLFMLHYQLSNRSPHIDPIN